jgi:ActR/RegA family two-component response regulator
MDIKDPASVDPARENNPDHENLRKATAAWIEENPDVYGLFLKFAREMAAQGKPFGVKLLAERVRWECLIHKRGEYKLNNNHVAYIARRLIMDDQTLVRFIRFRKTQW